MQDGRDTQLGAECGVVDIIGRILCEQSDVALLPKVPHLYELNLELEDL